MAEIRRTKYILHVSDFHLSLENEDFARDCLEYLCNSIDDKNITIDYLIHTGDIIDARGAYSTAIDDLEKEDSSLGWIRQEYLSDDGFDVNEFIKDPRSTADILQRMNNHIFENAENTFVNIAGIVKEFLANIRVRKRYTYFCVGNHDTIRPILKESTDVCNRLEQGDGDAQGYHKDLLMFEKKHKLFDAYTVFLHDLGVWNDNLTETWDQTPDLNLVILNTNHQNPARSKQEYHCIDCQSATEALNHFGTDRDDKRLNVVISHKPIYEICEAVRMAFDSYHKTEFMTAMQRFLGENGIYVCGDKHTRSVSDMTFHNVRHIIGGAPLRPKDGQRAFQVEYNLIELTEGKIGNTQKIHLSYDQISKKWSCTFRPEDSVVESLYELSKCSIIPQCLSVLLLDKKANSWFDISRIFFMDMHNPAKWTGLEKKLDTLSHIICKYWKMSPDTAAGRNPLMEWDKRDNEMSIFHNTRDYLIEKMRSPFTNDQNNILNIRGEYSAGKSTFLGILYIYLLFQYSVGNIDFIPAYFNLENMEILEKITESADIPYNGVAAKAFAQFVKKVQAISEKSHQVVCYIIDGLDEQDVWSYSSEDSIGRGILDIINTAPNSKNIMSFSQHHLPLFKNTMPERKYNDYSDVMYFNNVHTISAECGSERFTRFITAFYSLRNKQNRSGIQNVGTTPENVDTNRVNNICELIHKFRRLSVNQNFLYKFGGYFDEKLESVDSPEEITVDSVYRNYIDLLHKMCMDTLGYGYVHYAPAMAYLFSYKGFTYERFRKIPLNSEDHWYNEIAKYSGSVYDAFIFIKKNQDIREYLIAMHYNRELRYYAENPEIPISESSILNEFIPRNVAVLSRRMWKSDPNKFVIVCVELLEKRRDLGQKPICNCALSMLMYTLAHQEKMYAPSNTKLGKIISSYETSSGKISDTPNGGFSYTAKKSDILQLFLEYSFHRTYRLYKAELEGNSEKLALTLSEDTDFALYNRQYLLLYYGDLTISGENRKAALVPGQDICQKGFDFHNTFNFLSEKLNYAEKEAYALRAYDLFSLCDLIGSRLSIHSNSQQSNGTFFSGKKNVSTQIGVLSNAIRYINDYLESEPSANEDFGKILFGYKEQFEEAMKERQKTK